MHSITAIVWFLLPCLSPLSALSPLHLIGAIVLSACLSPKAQQTTLCASTHSSNTVTDLWNYNNCAAKDRTFFCHLPTVSLFSVTFVRPDQAAALCTLPVGGCIYLRWVTTALCCTSRNLHPASVRLCRGSQVPHCYTIP